MNDDISDHAATGVARQLINARQKLKDGKFVEAYHGFKEVIHAHQDEPRAWEGLGHSLEKLGKLNEAVDAYTRSIFLDPKNYIATLHLGNLLIELNENEKAIVILSKAADLNPSSASTLSNLATAYMNLRRFSDAAINLHRALAHNPKSIPTLLNLGTCMRENGKPDLAAQIFENALSIAPDSLEAVTRLGSTLSDLNKTDAALEVLDTYIETHPQDAECHQVKALVLLRAGRLDDGLRKYEWRHYPTRLGVSARPFTSPRWNGEDISGKTLLIWTEQGIGDELLSLSALRQHLSTPRSHQIMVECDSRICGLVRRSFPSVRVTPRQNPPSDEIKLADISCPAWTAVRHLLPDTGISTEPNDYLQTDSATTSSLRSRYEQHADGRKIIGVSWSSSARAGSLKTPPLENWARLLADDSYIFVSLQYSASADELSALANFSDGRFIFDAAIDATNDLDQSAAQIAAMDAVVTISNSTAHMAGALGVPVATVVPSGYGGFWYWFREREDNPWYPSMRICRQNTPGDWTHGIQEAIDWLEQLN
jgi:tetratricopeptide (TPR) repeat protein